MNKINSKQYFMQLDRMSKHFKQFAKGDDLLDILTNGIERSVYNHDTAKVVVYDWQRHNKTEQLSALRERLTTIRERVLAAAKERREPDFWFSTEDGHHIPGFGKKTEANKEKALNKWLKDKNGGGGGKKTEEKKYGDHDNFDDFWDNLSKSGPLKKGKKPRDVIEAEKLTEFKDAKQKQSDALTLIDTLTPLRGDIAKQYDYAINADFPNIKDSHGSGRSPASLVGSAYSEITEDSIPDLLKATKFMRRKLTKKDRAAENRVNDMNKAQFEKHKKLYRGTVMKELENFYSGGQKAGAGRPKVVYGKEQNFVSTTVYPAFAKRIAAGSDSDELPITIEYEMEDADPKTYNQMRYQVQPEGWVARGDDDEDRYRATEHYGGSHMINYGGEGEYHLKPGAKMKIARIYIPRNMALADGEGEENENMMDTYEEALKQAGVPDDVDIIFGRADDREGLYAKVSKKIGMKKLVKEYMDKHGITKEQAEQHFANKLY